MTVCDGIASRSADQPVVAYISRGDDPDGHFRHRRDEQYCTRPENPHLLGKRLTPQRGTVMEIMYSERTLAVFCAQNGRRPGVTLVEIKYSFDDAHWGRAMNRARDIALFSISRELKKKRKPRAQI